ncbi:MAG: TIGR04282 family arsenosugar biosynthesis glycosyltransferase [Thiohalospira sp.]
MKKVPSARLLVFAKAPVPGRVLTRLAPALDARDRARLHMRLTAATLGRLAGAGPWRSRLYAAPPAGDPFLRACARRHRIPLRPQRGRDLGERMRHALEEALAGGGPAVLVGTDLPERGPESVAAAFRALAEGADAVLQPTADGGYGLVGLSRPLPGLFRDIPWGTERVAAVSRERLRATGAEWRDLPATWDVDRPEDLARLDPALLRGLTPKSRPLARPAREAPCGSGP